MGCNTALKHTLIGIMWVIEALYSKIEKPRDHPHIKQKRTFA